MDHRLHISMVELRTTVIRGAATGPHLLITAGVHGDEFEGMVAVQRLMQGLKETDLCCGTVTLVPVVNERAFELRNRCGADGLDLARTCPGNPVGSPTEQVADALARLIQSADLYIDLHSGGIVMDVYPLAGYMLVSSERVLETQRQMACTFGLPLVWGTSDKLDGRSLSVARDAQVPAIYVEYRGSGRCDPCGVTALVAGCRKVLEQFGMLDSHPLDGKEAAGIEPIAHEDWRPESGHMQTGYPAPKSGLFEASVQLGKRIEQGDTLGILSDPFSGQSEKIIVTQSGSVIVLRTYPQVQQGDALAVILEQEGSLPML
jgi:predicted deacylase